MKTSPLSTFIVAVLALVVAAAAPADNDIRWQHLSSKNGDLPVPGDSIMQTGCVVGDFANDGITGFVISCRGKAPALIWYRKTAKGWDRYVIERELLPIEAGGAVYDIDGDGDLDIVFGGDYQGSDVWWWENPSPKFDPNVAWKRRFIKKGGKTQHHDQVFADLLGTGKPQLAFWNQNARTIFLAEIPEDPRGAETWPLTAIYSGSGGEETRDTFKYPEGISAFDIDADGRLELLAGNTILKHAGDKKFQAIRFADVGGLIFAGYFKATKYPQIVIAPGDGVGPVRFYECVGNPLEAKDWRGRDLLERHAVHGHSLQLGDINRDGHLDIFCAEMAKWRERQPNPDHPDATAWILYGDGQGNFRKTELVKGHGWHEARLADLDGDGDLDLVNKPYTWQTPRVDVWLNNGTRPARGTGASASFKGPVGLQLYSLRDIAKDNLPLALQTTRGFGFVEVELAGTYGLPPAELKKRLDWHGLKPVSGFWPFEQWEKDPESAAREAHALGVRYAGCAWIPHQQPFDEADCRKAIAVFNRAGEVAARHGLKFFYHNHGYEFARHGEGTLLDLLMKETRPELVGFQMDVFWTVHPGQDPVQLLRKYPQRWQLLHIKDMRKGVATGKLTGSEDVRTNVPLGTGQIDLAATLKAAQEIGVKHYFIEDESPAVVEQMPQSLRFLETLAW